MATLTADDLRSALEHRLNAIDCAGTFYSHQQILELVNPGLQVAGLGRFGSPLYERDARTLIGASHQSPFGKGESTRIDTDVRRSWEIDAGNISFTHPNWAWNEKQFLDTACNQLGVGGGSRHVRAELYKLLIYEEGAMFKPHKDSEKAPGMFATMVVCLPGPHEGGNVALTFNGESATLATDICSEWQCSVLAWYADVVHEVKPVRSGFRVALTYNLIFTGNGAPPNLVHLDESKAGLRDVLTNWRATLSATSDLPSFLAYPFEHKYTDANISLQHLKRRDAARTLCMSQVAAEYDFQCCLATMEKHEMYQDDESAENELELKSITNLEGHTLLQGVSVNENAVARNVWNGEADEQDEEHTGNAGVERSYWYRNSVLLIMPSKHYVDLAMDSSFGTYSSSRHASKQQFIDGCLAEAYESRYDQRKIGYLERICELLLQQPPPKQYDYGNDRYPDNLTSQLITSCLQFDFHDLVERALRSASPYMSNIMLDHLLSSIPINGFADALQNCVKTALSRLASLKARMDGLQKVTAVMHANGMSSEAQTWRVEQSDHFLSLPLGQEDEVMPILEDMLRQHRDETWIRESLLPALQRRQDNIGILTTLAAKLLSLAVDLGLDRIVTAGVYSQLISDLLAKLSFPDQKPAPPDDDDETLYWHQRKIPELISPVKPQDLAQAHWNSVQLQLMDEAGSLSTKIIEEASGMYSDLLPQVVTPYLQSMVSHWPKEHVAYDDPHYHMLFCSLISSYIHRHVQEEPRLTWVKKPIGCGSCQECSELDRFLLDPNRKSHTMSIYYKRDVDHIQGICTYRHRSFLRLVSEPSRRNPYVLTATKLNEDYETEHRTWKARADKATRDIMGIAEEAILRQILGPRYDELTMLHAVRIASMGHATQTRDTQTLRPMDRHQASNTTTSTMSTMPVQVAGIKRGHDWLSDQHSNGYGFQIRQTDANGIAYASPYQQRSAGGPYGGPPLPHQNAGPDQSQQRYYWDPAVGYRARW